MPRILLDGSELRPSPAAETWGAVLRVVDETLAGSGRIVTDVRFDGLDEPAFRETSTLDRPLARLVIVDVQSGTPDSLMDRCLDEALAAIPPLCAAATLVGEGYRAHQLGTANSGLIELADGLSSLVAIVGAAELAFQVDLRQVRLGDQAAATVVAELASCLEALVSAQEVGDWITVADVLQLDVEPALKRLAPILESLRQKQSAA
jgi:hypothetical protein